MPFYSEIALTRYLWRRDGNKCTPDIEYKNIHKRFINGSASPKRLNYLFPPEVSSQALIKLALGENPRKIWDTVLAPAIEKGKERVRRIAVPLKWQSVTDSTNLVAPFGTGNMTKKEWYGEFYNNSAAEGES